MSETVFTKVDYDLGALVKYIGLGEIGLPDIQRPFVWNNAKVRDLFDSMYKGYPVGYLLLWQSHGGGGLPDDRRRSQAKAAAAGDRGWATATDLAVRGDPEYRGVAGEL
jgi:hypothetical protein